MKRITALADRLPRPVWSGVKMFFYVMAAVTFPVWFLMLIAIWLLMAFVQAFMDLLEYVS